MTKTSIFVLIRPPLKMYDQGEYICLDQDVLKTSSRRLLKAQTKEVFKTSSRRLHQGNCLLGNCVSENTIWHKYSDLRCLLKIICL